MQNLPSEGVEFELHVLENNHVMAKPHGRANSWGKNVVKVHMQSYIHGQRRSRIPLAGLDLSEHKCTM